MNLSRIFIIRPVMTTLVMLALLMLGTTAYFKLPVSSLPDVDYPVITVTVPFPGTNPKIMANTVATPLEQQFMTIPGIKNVTSANTLGNTQIILEFDINKNIDLVAVDVQSAIVAATPLLPPNLPQAPTFKKVNPSSTPIFYFAVTSPTMTLGELYDYAYTFLGQRLSIVEGVAQVLAYGSPYAVRAQLDPGHLASLGLIAEDVATALANANQYQPLGQIDGNATAAPIYDNGGLLNADGFKPVIVSFVNGSPVRLEDLGLVVNSVQMDRSDRRFINNEMNQPSVTLAILRQPGANTVKVVDTIKALMPSLKEQLPHSLQVIEVFDRSASIRQSIDEVQWTLVIAFLLVVLVVFFYLGKIRETIIPSLIMPMSVIGTFAVIYILGYTLDNLSLLALILAVGFIIDDAIVVIENIERRVEAGESPKEASLEGSKQISFTILSMTLSLVAVFIPLLFMAGLVGKLFQEFAVTLTVVTLMSGIISLTLTPMLCSLFIRPHKNGDSRMAKFSKKFNGVLLKHYKRALEWVLLHRAIAVIIGLLSVVLSFVLFAVLPKDFIPDEDIGFIFAYTESEQGTSSDQMNAYQREIVEILRNEESIDSMISITGTPVYRQGIIFIKLIEPSKREAIKNLVPLFNKKLSLVPGINVFLKPLPLIDLNIGSQVRGAYQFLIQSLNSEQLYKSSSALVDKMKEDPLFQGISTDLEIKTPEIDLDIQRDLASTLGIDVAGFEQSLFLGYSGNRISRMQTPINQYDVIVELNRNLQRDASSLDSIYLRSMTTNNLVPLNAIVNLKEGVGPASINHFDQFPAVTISFNIDPKVPLSEGLARLRKIAAETFDPAVTGDVKGAAQAFEESFKSLNLLLFITIIVIYIVLGILYESFIHPLTILSTLPPAIFGGLLTLFVIQKPLSLYAFLGLILLIGIVKKNGIMMVDFALDNIRNKGESAEKSIIDACVVRFRPIMMTTFAAIMGAIPVAVGSESHRPLGFVIIGGLCISQLVTLFLTPVIYLYFEEMREKFLPRKKLKYEPL